MRNKQEERENEQNFGYNSRSTDDSLERSDNAGPVQNSEDTKTDAAETAAAVSARSAGVDSINTADHE
jgi:hypothetical protein